MSVSSLERSNKETLESAVRNYNEMSKRADRIPRLKAVCEDIGTEDENIDLYLGSETQFSHGSYQCFLCASCKYERVMKVVSSLTKVLSFETGM